jgi:hypothetical protein
MTTSPLNVYTSLIVAAKEGRLKYLHGLAQQPPEWVNQSNPSPAISQFTPHRHMGFPVMVAHPQTGLPCRGEVAMPSIFAVGDAHWLKEPFYYLPDGQIGYVADLDLLAPLPPVIHQDLPAEASRFMLIVKDVTATRLQDLSEETAYHSGVDMMSCNYNTEHSYKNAVVDIFGGVDTLMENPWIMTAELDVQARNILVYEHTMLKSGTVH